MQTEIVSYAGWQKNLRLFNDSVELIVTLEVGPRIISYRHHQGKNILKQYEEQLGKSGESEWCIRGGHRLWTAPEDFSITYHIDNEPVVFSQLPDNKVLLTNYLKSPIQLRKEITISLDGDMTNSSHVTLHHRIVNEGKSNLTLAPWALTVMAPGGLAIIPQPPLGEHPRDLSPNRNIVLWPYTDLSDSRWHFGTKYFTFQQKAGSPPIKLGLAHRERWVAYALDRNLFIKSFSFQEGAHYPDGGCNFETFSNSDMIEIESLGPLSEISSGDAVHLQEDWYLFPLEEPIQSENDLENRLPDFLRKTHLL